MKRHLLHLFWVLLAVALLWVAGSRQEDLLIARQRYHLDHAEPLENAPPLLVFTTVALGGFSGVLSDLMWVRAAQLQMEGNYLELVQLADWITKLQPRFAQGWIYHAWNLAYNVSVMFPQPEDRWRWVRHGIELLRDGGLRYNPAHPTLYREMAWIFQHKLGMTTDAAHAYYKMAWAMEMERLFDGRGPDYAALAATPATRTALLRVAGMPALIDALREHEIDPFTYQWPPADQLEAMKSIARTHAEAGDLLLRHVRLRMMIDRYRLTPDRMLEIEHVIGPLDWRLPQAHAVYWAWSGIPYASGWEAVMLDRMVFQSMAEAFRQGNYFFSPEEDRFIPSPAPDMLPYVERAYERSLEQYDDDETMRTAHLHFLNHALTVMFTHDREAAARGLFERVRNLYPAAVGKVDFHRYLLDQLARDPVFEPFEAVEYRIAQALYLSFYWQALGDEARAAGYQQAAEWFWHYDASQDAFDYWELESGAREAVLNDLISDISKARIR